MPGKKKQKKKRSVHSKWRPVIVGASTVMNLPGAVIVNRRPQLLFSEIVEGAVTSAQTMSRFRLQGKPLAEGSPATPKGMQCHWASVGNYFNRAIADYSEELPEEAVRQIEQHISKK